MAQLNTTESNPLRQMLRRLASVGVALFFVFSLTPVESYFASGNVIDYEDALTFEELTASLSAADLAAEDGFLQKPNLTTDEAASDRSGQSGFLVYTVEAGDTLTSIAELWGVSEETIKMENNIYDVNSVKEGVQLRIPPVDGVIHKVEKDQTLSGIAKKYEVTVEDIIAQNQLGDDEPIQPGMNLVIPGGAKEVKAPAPPKVYVASSSNNSYSSYSAPAVVNSVPPAAYSGDLSPGGFIWPTVGSARITQYYGGGHPALDIATREPNTPIYAAASGTAIVAAYGYNGGYGNYVQLDHGNGVVTLYGHFASLNVTPGQYVNQGDVLGIMGSTGRSTGPHVHFEIHVNGYKQNPLAYY